VAAAEHDTRRWSRAAASGSNLRRPVFVRKNYVLINRSALNPAYALTIPTSGERCSMWFCTIKRLSKTPLKASF
jgi:hypothetical protein